MSKLGSVAAAFRSEKTNKEEKRKVHDSEHHAARLAILLPEEDDTLREALKLPCKRLDSRITDSHQTNRTDAHEKTRARTVPKRAEAPLGLASVCSLCARVAWAIENSGLNASPEGLARTPLFQQPGILPAPSSASHALMSPFPCNRVNKYIQ